MENQKMETITIHPKNKKQATAIRNFLKAFGVSFESDEKYDPEFVAKIKESQKQIRDGKFTSVNSKEELRAFLGLL